MSTPNNNSVTQYEQQQQAALNAGGQGIESAFSGFSPQFYTGREQAYENYAMPQLGQQYRQTANKMNLGLANEGILKGSAAEQLQSALQVSNAQAEENITNTGTNLAQQLQQQVAGQKSELYSQLQESLNPTQTTQSAVNLAAQTAAPSIFQPLGQAFSNFATMYLANNQANTYNPITSAYLYNPYYVGGTLPNSGGQPANPLASGVQ